MADKRAKFCVFLVVAIIGIICSASLYSFTGGISDWMVNSVEDEDANNNGYLDSSEKDYYSNSADNDERSSDDENNGSIFSFASGDSSSDSDSSSSDEPDFFARIVRYIINSGDSDSNLNSGFLSSSDDGEGISFSSRSDDSGLDSENVLSDGEDIFSTASDGISKVFDKVDGLFRGN